MIKTRWWCLRTWWETVVPLTWALVQGAPRRDTFLQVWLITFDISIPWFRFCVTCLTEKQLIAWPLSSCIFHCCDQCWGTYYAAHLILSPLRVINVKFPLQPHQKYYIYSHSMENMAFHSSLRWKTITLPILATTLIHFLFKRLGECTFWA